MEGPEIVNNLMEEGATKAVRLPDGRLITASLAKILGISVPPQDVSVPLPDGLIYDTETD